MMQPSRKGKHRDPQAHAAYALAYYHKRKDEPAYREQRRRWRANYYARWLRSTRRDIDERKEAICEL